MTDSPPPPSTNPAPPTTGTDPTAAQPVHIPPSVGGSGLAIVSGLLLGRNVVESVLLGTDVPLMAWLVPVVLLGFVGALLQFALMARERVGLQVSSRSIRRQWWVIAGAFGSGLLFGAAFPYVNGA